MLTKLSDLRPVQTKPVLLDEVIAAVSNSSAVPSDLDVTGVSLDSADICAGDVFVAVRGETTHGAHFAPAAVQAGAVAVVTDDEGAQLCVDLSVPVVVINNPRYGAGVMADLVYGHPSRKLTTLGVTGTNGKTSSTYFMYNALSEKERKKVALISTVETIIGETTVESIRTTTEAPVIHRLLAKAVEDGCVAAVIEVSSHAIALGRIEGIRFDTVAFTNLQHDHLDYHSTQSEYFAAKAAMFDQRYADHAVVAVDDEWGKKLAKITNTPVTTISTRGDQADWEVIASESRMSDGCVSFELQDPLHKIHMGTTPMPGFFNVQNVVVSAVSVALATGKEIDQVLTDIADTAQVPGRMETVASRTNDQAWVVVDYAHNPEGLQAALEAARPVTPGKLILVFGAEGNRDMLKRPIMGRIAAEGADLVVLTDDSPWLEDPDLIRVAVAKGWESIPHGPIWEVGDRISGMALGLALAGPDDTVLITGRGHEKTQKVAGEYIDFLDTDETRKLLQATPVSVPEPTFPATLAR